jgi:hypothetical protein
MQTFNNTKYNSVKKTAKWESMLFRPELPQHWSCQEQLDKPGQSYISFVRHGKIHHNDEARKIYVVFCEFEPGLYPYRYTVRGGRHVKPEEKLKYFNDIKSAKNYMIYLMENTNRWINEVNDPKTVRAYESNIKKQVAAQIKYEESVKEAMGL